MNAFGLNRWRDLMLIMAGMFLPGVALALSFDELEERPKARAFNADARLESAEDERLTAVEKAWLDRVDQSCRCHVDMGPGNTSCLYPWPESKQDGSMGAERRENLAWFNGSMEKLCRDWRQQRRTITTAKHFDATIQTYVERVQSRYERANAEQNKLVEKERKNRLREKRAEIARKNIIKESQEAALRDKKRRLEELEDQRQKDEEMRQQEEDERQQKEQARQDKERAEQAERQRAQRAADDQRVRDQGERNRKAAEQNAVRLKEALDARERADRERALRAQREQEERERVAEAQRRRQLEEQAQREREAERRREEQAAAARERERVKAQAERDRQLAQQRYLAQMESGIRLQGKNCFGKQYAIGVLPNVYSAERVCIDVHFRATCTGNSSQQGSGVIKNMQGMSTGCYGDTGAISPTLNCLPEEMRVTVSSVQRCR